MVAVRCKVKVKSPASGKWKKVEAVFDPDAVSDQVSARFLRELKADFTPGHRKFLEVEVLGEHLLWEFEVIDHPDFQILFGKNFIQTNGVIVEANRVRFAPGHPQPAVI